MDSKSDNQCNVSILPFQVLVISALAFAVAKKGDEHRVSEIEGISDGLKSLVSIISTITLCLCI